MTAPEQRAAALRRCPLFADLSDEDLTRLAVNATLRRYRRGQIVFAEGDSGDALFVVVEGLVQILRYSDQGTQLLLTTVGPGESLGELAVVDGGTRSATAETLTPCTLVRVDRAVVANLAAERPPFANALLRALAALIRRLTGSTADLVFLDLPRRVAKLLLDQPRQGDVVELPLTQSQIASRVGGSRQSVNLALRDFERRGWIRGGPHSVRILDLGALQRFAAS
jgi:CRP/FNR family transcriptional regulator, cyclic AMP receptor protein